MEREEVIISNGWFTLTIGQTKFFVIMYFMLEALLYY